METGFEPDLVGDKAHCYKCGQDRTLTGKWKVVEARRDPTQVYELKECGHWVL